MPTQTRAPEAVDENLLTAQLQRPVNALIGFTRELVRWEIPRIEEPLAVRRIEWIPHEYR